MGEFFAHWLWMDFWTPVWPNIAASLLVAVWVTFRLHVLRKAHEQLKELHVEHHREHMEAIRQVTGTSNPDTLEQGGDLW